MNNGNIVINEFSLFQKNKEKMREYAQRPEVKVRRRKYDREWYHKNKEKIKEYAQRPEIKARRKEYVKKSEVKARRKEYNQRPNIKARKRKYEQRSEVKARKREYNKKWYQRNKEKIKEYAQRSEVKVRRREYNQRPEMKEKVREYAQRSEVKARRKEYKKIRQQLNKQEKEKQRELQSGRVSTLKQNFDLSSFNCDDMCSEQIKNIAWDVLELQLYSETQETELDKLLEKIEFEYMVNEEQSSVMSSENFSFNLIYDDVYDERVIKDVLNNLELDQLNLLDKSIEQLLVGKKIAEQNIEWNNSIVVTSNLDSDIYDYNLSTGLIP